MVTDCEASVILPACVEPASVAQRELRNLLAFADQAFASGQRILSVALIESVFRLLDEQFSPGSTTLSKQPESTHEVVA